MFIGTRNPLAVGAELTVRTLTEPAFEVQARVARSVKVPPALQMVKQPGMGLHFFSKGVGTRLAEDVAASAPLADDGASPDEELPTTPAASEDSVGEPPPKQPAVAASSASEPTTDETTTPASPTGANGNGASLSAAAPVKEETSATPERPSPDRSDLSTANVPAKTPPQDSESGSANAKLLQERRMLQDRVSQLEEKVGSLYSDNQSLRRYSDLLENTRKRLTADVATVRTELTAEKKSSQATQDLAAEVHTLEEKGAETRAEQKLALETALAEIERLRGDIEKAQAREEKLAKDVSRLETESTNQKKEIDKGQAQLQQKKSDLEAREKSTPKPRSNSKSEAELKDLRGEVDRLRANNADLSNQLQTALEFEAEPAQPGVDRRFGGPAVWAALAGVALLGFIFGFLFRPSGQTELVVEGTTNDRGAVSETATTAPVATPESEEESAATETAANLDLPPQPVAPDLDTVSIAIDQWASAWADQDVDSYLAAYSVDFVPALGYDWDSWSSNRRERLLAPASIELGVSELEVVDTGLGRATARFVQSYSTPTYEDRVRKTLEMGWEGEEWRILGEFSEPIE